MASNAAHSLAKRAKVPAAVYADRRAQGLPITSASSATLDSVCARTLLAQPSAVMRVLVLTASSAVPERIELQEISATSAMQDFSWMTMPNADLSHVLRGQVTPAVDAHLRASARQMDSASAATQGMS